MGESIDTLGEIYLERARYLLNTDEMLEEMMSKTYSGITENTNAEFPWNAGTVCCGALIETDETHGPETCERFHVCSINCKRFEIKAA